MKTKCSSLIYNKTIVYFCFKCYTYIFGKYKKTHIAFNLIELKTFLNRNPIKLKSSQ